MTDSRNNAIIIENTNDLEMISNATGVQNLTFDTITDYLVLIIYQLKLLEVSKNDMKRLLTGYTECVERLRSSIPASTFNQIIFTDEINKQFERMVMLVEKHGGI